MLKIILKYLLKTLSINLKQIKYNIEKFYNLTKVEDENINS